MLRLFISEDLEMLGRKLLVHANAARTLTKIRGSRMCATAIYFYKSIT